MESAWSAPTVPAGSWMVEFPGPQPRSRMWRAPAGSSRAIRAHCPCAGCVEEWSGRRTVGEAQVKADVKPQGMSEVGRYAMQIEWSDGHSTGIFSWDYLLKLREEQLVDSAR